MREIKFRAWDKDFHQMFPVTTMKIKDDDFQVISNQQMLLKFELMQYTCLKDNNGKEIYEGDIIAGRNFNYIVEWRDDIAVWQCDPIQKEHLITSSKNLFELCEFDNCEIKGNIYENPELIN